jgi:hypothetical protein
MEQSKWEEVVISWMCGKSFELDENESRIGLPKEKEEWQIVDLEQILLKRELIPEFICGDDAFYDILIRRMQCQLILCVGVPERPQMGMGFGHVANCKSMLVHEILADVHKRKEAFEKKTGVNLDHYYRLALTKKRGEKRKQEEIEAHTKLKKNVKLGIYFVVLIKF